MPAAEHLIRATLASTTRLHPGRQLASPGDIVAIQLFFLVLLVRDLRIDGEELERLLDSCEPIARQALANGEFGELARTVAAWWPAIVTRAVPAPHTPGAAPPPATPNGPQHWPSSPTPQKLSPAPASPRQTGGSPKRSWLLGLAVVAGVVGVAAVAGVAVWLVPSLLGGSKADLPAKPANFFKVYSPTYALGLRTKQIAEDAGIFRGPHFVMRFDQVLVTEAIDEILAHELGEPGPFRAATGHEFVAARVASDPTLRVRWSDKAAVSYRIVVGQRVIELDSPPEGNDILFLSVPRGARPLLEVTDAGRAQTFDLRSGRRAKVETLLYPIRTASLPPRVYDEAGIVAYGGARQGVRVQILSPGGTATLEPYLPGLGWARRGRAWLLLTPLSPLVIEERLSSSSGYFGVAFDMDTKRSFVLRHAGGAIRAKDMGHVKMHLDTNGDNRFSVVFDVPASLREGQITISPRGVFATQLRGATLQGIANLRPSEDCGTPNIPCLDWSSPPAGRRVGIQLMP
jgi:hypothetical protein